MGDDALDPPETLLGQLQRGLGRGYLASTRGGVGKDELLHCIVHDPRWDRQVEERATYYAKLAIELRVDVEPIASAVRAGDPRDWEGGLAADVLMGMAVRGREDALEALREELRHDGWLLALAALDDAEQEYGRKLLEPDDLHLVAGRPAEELKPLFFNHAHLPWRQWAATVPSLEALLEEEGAAEPPSLRPDAPKPDTSMSTAELLRIAEPRNGVKVARVLAQRRDADSIAAMEEAARGSDHNPRLAAFRALGAQGHPGLLDHVTELLETKAPELSRLRGADLLRYLEALPADESLPRARDWLSKSGRAAIAAEHILARHARAEDRVVVEATLARALDDEAIYRACSMVEALTGIEDPRSTDVLVQTFERIPYSWARPRVLRALAACRSEALGALATEALWDSDEEAREVAAEEAPLTQQVQERLEEIGDDALEEERVRAAAQGRRS